MIVLDKIAKVQVWDTAGQERYRSITNAYYRGAEAIMIIFDMTNKQSFLNIQNWIDEVVKYTGDDVIIIIGGNKTDLTQREVSKEEIEGFAKKKDFKVFEMSAKNGSGVEDAFKYVVELLIKKNTKQDETPIGIIELDKEKGDNKDNKAKGCC